MKKTALDIVNNGGFTMNIVQLDITSNDTDMYINK